MDQAMPAYPLGSRPSSWYRSFKSMAVAWASSTVADHSKIFLAQYMRMYPCIFPRWIISLWAAFQSGSWVAALSKVSWV